MTPGPWKDRAGMATPMTIPKWQSREEWEIWWAAHVVAFNRLSVTDPREWERIAQVIEKFNQENKR